MQNINTRDEKCDKLQDYLFVHTNATNMKLTLVNLLLFQLNCQPNLDVFFS